jgi:hypothetical protein
MEKQDNKLTLRLYCYLIQKGYNPKPEQLRDEDFEEYQDTIKMIYGNDKKQAKKDILKMTTEEVYNELRY